MNLYLSPRSLEISHSGGMAVYVNSLKMAFEEMAFELVDKPDTADIWHELDGFNVNPNFFSKSANFSRKFITIHDLQEMDFPDRFSQSERNKRANVYKNLLENPHVNIICISNFTKLKIKEHYPELENKLIVIPHAVSHFSPGPNKHLGKRVTPFPAGKYALVLTKGWGHKNISKVILEIAEQSRELRSSEFGFVIAGDIPTTSGLQEILDHYKIQDLVSFTGHLSEDEKVDYILSAGVCLSASDYEGFGLVAYEAKSVGKKFIGFDLDVMSEIFADEYFSPIPTGNFPLLVEAAIEALNALNAEAPISRTWNDVATDLVFEYWDSELPLVSVITASFNRENVLDRVLNSLDNQSYQNYEHIVVDGASTDHSVAIFMGRNKTNCDFVSEPDEGIYDGFNKGLARAKGSLIVYLNTDDWFEGDFLRKSVAMHLSGKLDFSYGDIWLHQPNSVIRSIPSRSNYGDRIETNFVHFHHTTVLASKKMFDVLGEFPRYINFPRKRELRICADYLWFLRAHKKGFRGLKNPNIVGHMEWGGISTTQHMAAVKEGLLCALNAYPLRILRASISWGQCMLRLKINESNSSQRKIKSFALKFKSQFPKTYLLSRRILYRTYLKLISK